jgi:ribosomal protein S13
MRILKLKSNFSYINIYIGNVDKIRIKSVTRLKVFVHRERYKFFVDQNVVMSLKRRMSRVAIGLYGFGALWNKRVFNMFGTNGSYLSRALRTRQLLFVRNNSLGVFKYLIFGRPLHDILFACFQRHYAAGSYIFIRLLQGLPFKGQRSHTNARTMKYFRIKIKSILHLKDPKKKPIPSKNKNKNNKKKNKKK